MNWLKAVQFWAELRYLIPSRYEGWIRLLSVIIVAIGYHTLVEVLTGRFEIRHWAEFVIYPAAGALLYALYKACFGKSND